MVIFLIFKKFKVIFLKKYFKFIANFIDIFCYNSNKTLDRTTNCSIYVLSQSFSNFIEVSHANNISNFTNNGGKF